MNLSAYKHWDPEDQMPPGREFEAYHHVTSQAQAVVYHSHPFFELFFFLSGHTRIVVEGMDVELSRGDVLVYPPGVMRRNIHLDAQVPYERFYLYATREFLNSVSTADCDIPGTLERMTRDDHYRFHVEEKDLRELVRQTDAVIAASGLSRPEEKLMTRCRFTALLLEAMSMMTSLDAVPQDDYSKGMGALIRYINLHVTEPLPLDELARVFHMSKYYLLREFKSYTGISVHQYLMIRRIQVSQELIRRGAKPRDACYQSGFMDYSSYYRAFRTRVGVSPEQYRQSVQK